MLDFSHLFDMLRHVAGEPATVTGTTVSFLSSADDCFMAAFELPGDAVASLEASSCATGREGQAPDRGQRHRRLGSLLAGHDARRGVSPTITAPLRGVLGS